ncbi:hypothetical protein [Shewanella surugensis]|uniref:Uncharacterized protein n=1 Tax=Shewanella surugensis TaxID=212020 RepID=A0ABT0LEA2_9GAMM|nr:hypothetical protein [Shewanella surugensis]MCL1126029.1 hypothetical protein [Shewanella surugensis]
MRLELRPFTHSENRHLEVSRVLLEGEVKMLSLKKQFVIISLFAAFLSSSIQANDTLMNTSELSA